jgi:hypothetical protein
LLLLLLHPAATVAPPIKVNVSFKNPLRFIECVSMRVAVARGGKTGSPDLHC